MRAPLVIALSVAAVGLAGCAEAPRPPLMSPLAQAAEFGYSDQDLSGNRLEVTYLGPRRRVPLSHGEQATAVKAAQKQADDLALWRAAQVAQARGKPAFTVVNRHTDVEVTIRDRYDPYPWGWPGYYPYSWWRDPFFYPPYPPYSAYRDAYAQAQAKLTVELLDKMKPGAHDAAATAAEMSAKYGAKAQPKPTQPKTTKPDAGKSGTQGS
jgi:hypothetical protein